jgi:MFS transporter, AAHS family, 4-hydroxybenzoate transporter
MVVIYTFFSWTPVILASLTLPLTIAVRGSILFNLAGVAGTALTAWAVSHNGSRKPAIALALAGIAGLSTRWTTTA